MAVGTALKIVQSDYTSDPYEHGALDTASTTFVVGHTVTATTTTSRGAALPPYGLWLLAANDLAPDGVLAWTDREAFTNDAARRVVTVTYNTTDIAQNYTAGPIGVTHLDVAKCVVHAEVNRSSLLAIDSSTLLVP